MHEIQEEGGHEQVTRLKYLQLEEKVRQSVIRAVLKFEKQLPSRKDEHIGTTKETKLYIIEYRGYEDGFSTMEADYAVTIKATGQKMLAQHYLATFHHGDSGWTFIDKGLIE